MRRHRDFSACIGNVFIPIADEVVVSDFSGTPFALESAPNSPGVTSIPMPAPIPERLINACKTILKNGCYTLNFLPKNTPIVGPRYRGTLRVEHIGSEIIFSGDFYSFITPIVVGPPIVLCRFCAWTAFGRRARRLRTA
jgi:hypothetical protein